MHRTPGCARGGRASQWHGRGHVRLPRRLHAGDCGGAVPVRGPDLALAVSINIPLRPPPHRCPFWLCPALGILAAIRPSSCIVVSLCVLLHFPCPRPRVTALSVVRKKKASGKAAASVGVGTKWCLTLHHCPARCARSTRSRPHHPSSPSWSWETSLGHSAGCASVFS